MRLTSPCCADSPIHDWHDVLVEVRLVCTVDIEAAPGCCRQVVVERVANDSGGLELISVDALRVSRAFWGWGGAYPKIGISCVVDRVGLNDNVIPLACLSSVLLVLEPVHDDAMALTYSNDDVVGTVGLNGDEVGRDNAETMSIDRKDKGGVSCAVDDSHQICDTLDYISRKPLRVFISGHTFWNITSLNFASVRSLPGT